MGSVAAAARPAKSGTCEQHLWEHDGNWLGPVLKHEYRCRRCGETRRITAGDDEAYEAMLREGDLYQEENDDD